MSTSSSRTGTKSSILLTSRSCRSSGHFRHWIPKDFPDQREADIFKEQAAQPKIQHGVILRNEEGMLLPYTPHLTHTTIFMGSTHPHFIDESKEIQKLDYFHIILKWKIQHFSSVGALMIPHSVPFPYAPSAWRARKRPGMCATEMQDTLRPEEQCKVSVAFVNTSNQCQKKGGKPRAEASAPPQH